MPTVVYTAIFGEYDDLHQPSPQDEPCVFICFTDGDMPCQVGAWHIIHVPPLPGVHPRLQAKWFKLRSHEVFIGGQLAARFAPQSLYQGADLTIWIDGNRRIKGSTFVKDMRRNLGDGDWAMFVHPDRDCIYEEAETCAGLVKCKDMPVLEQANAYRSVVPSHSGLFACTVIVRREPSTAHLIPVYEMWWEEILTRSIRDQISLPFVLRHHDETCQPVLIREHLRINEWFETVPHNSNL